MALIDDAMASAQVRAATPLAVLAIKHDDFQHLLDTHPDMAIQFYRHFAAEMARRLRAPTSAQGKRQGVLLITGERGHLRANRSGRMRTADEWFEAYGESHQNPINKAIHWVCVPVIVFATLGLLACTRAGSHRASWGRVGALCESWIAYDVSGAVRILRST